VSDPQASRLVRQLGDQAQRILSDPAFTEAVARAEAEIAGAMLATDPADDAGRRDLHAEYRALRRLVGDLKSVAGDGRQETGREIKRQVTMGVFRPVN
jgi:hypothetical protein